MCIHTHTHAHTNVIIQQQTRTHGCLLHISYKVHHINYSQTSVTKALVCIKKKQQQQQKNNFTAGGHSRFTDFISQQQLTRTGQIALQAPSQYSFCTLLRDEQIYSILPCNNSAPHLISVCSLHAPKPWGSVEVGSRLTIQTDIKHTVCPEKEPIWLFSALCSLFFLSNAVNFRMDSDADL